MSTNTEQRIDLTVSGMTCAACAARIEKKLNRVDGVTASVNYATEKASILVPTHAVTADDLIATIRSIGYDAAVPIRATVPSAAQRTVGNDQGSAEPTLDPVARTLRLRLFTAIGLGLPVLILSMIPPLQFRNWQWLSFALAAPVATWCAWPFHRVAWKNARQAEATMDTLVSIGVIAAFGWSTFALFFTSAGDNGMTMPMSIVPNRADSHHLYLEVASATVALILLGRYFEARARHQSTGALRALAALQATEASVLQADGTELIVAADSLRPGQQFVVRPGQQIASDGIVVDGTSAVDASLITGESMPVEVGPGDHVVGATVNASGRLVVQATRVGADTSLAQISRLVEQAQTGKADVQRLADRVSAIFVPTAIVLAVITLGWWTARTGSFASAIQPAVAVLIIACPCALGLATPTALLVGTGRGAQLGLLIRGPQVLESTRRVDTIVLDKTGTITTGVMTVVHVSPVGLPTGETESGSEQLLALAAAVESGSEHPIGRAIALHADALTIDLPLATGVHAQAGSAIVGTVNGQTVRVGRPDPSTLTGNDGNDGCGNVTGGSLNGTKGGFTVVEVTVDGLLIGSISLSDVVRPTSKSGIDRLKSLGLRPMLLTGDNETVAALVAGQVGIDRADVIAGVLPSEKLDIIAGLQREGRVVAMVGDGINDAAALAQADLGISMGSGTDVAKEASDLTLMRPSLEAAADAIRLGRRTLSVIKGNLVWAFGYNIAAIPLAMSWRLSPVVASAAMACSSVFVVTNSLRLRRFR